MAAQVVVMVAAVAALAVLMAAVVMVAMVVVVSLIRGGINPPNLKTVGGATPTATQLCPIFIFGNSRRAKDQSAYASGALAQEGSNIACRGGGGGARGGDDGGDVADLAGPVPSPT